MKIEKEGIEEKKKSDATPKEETLKDCVYHLKNKKEGKTVQVHHFIDYLFVLLIIAVISLVMVGNVFPSFPLDIFGTVGLLVELKSRF